MCEWVRVYLFIYMYSHRCIHIDPHIHISIHIYTQIDAQHTARSVAGVRPFSMQLSVGRVQTAGTALARQTALARPPPRIQHGRGSRGTRSTTFERAGGRKADRITTASPRTGWPTRSPTWICRPAVQRLHFRMQREPPARRRTTPARVGYAVHSTVLRRRIRQARHE